MSLELKKKHSLLYLLVGMTPLQTASKLPARTGAIRLRLHHIK
jgi:hypothetical protein